VESTALLLKRVNELRALEKIKALQGTDVYLNAVKAAALLPAKTAEGLITDPIDTARESRPGSAVFSAESAVRSPVPVPTRIAW